MYEGRKYWRAFGSLFFLLHQGKLLWLLNAPVIGRWFRWVLRISGDSSSVGSLKIDRIIPNAIFWWHGDKQVAEFRTHAKFSKRLYYAFRPLWWMLHAWDWCVADRWVPELSFGFSTLTAYPNAVGDASPTTVNGIVRYSTALGSGVSWATIHDATAGTTLQNANDSPSNIQCDSTINNFRRIYRGVFLFDTSALGNGSNISSAIMSLYGTGMVNNFGGSPSIDVYTSNPVSNTTLDAEDYDQVGATSQTGSPITYAVWIISGYNNFTLNATGISNVSKTGISKFGTRNVDSDVANVAPTWVDSAVSYVTCYFAEQTGTTTDPKLVVTYTTAVPIADAGSGSDALGIAATLPLTDSGSGADLLSLAAQVPLVDAGSGADVLALTGLIPQADAGSGDDLVAIASDGPLDDAGSGSDVLGVIAMIPLEDMGTGLDVLEVFRLLENPLLADSGHGVDSMDVNKGGGATPEDSFIPCFRRRRR